MQEDEIYEKLRGVQAGVVDKMKGKGGGGECESPESHDYDFQITVAKEAKVKNLPTRMWMLRGLFSMS